MSNSENRANELASELKGLPTEIVEASVRPETAQAELAACTLAVRRRTAMARPCRGRLGCGNAMAEVRRVLRRGRQGRWCK